MLNNGFKLNKNEETARWKLEKIKKKKSTIF